MAQRKCDITVGHRMVQELYRLFPNRSDKFIMQQLRCDRKNMSAWKNGKTPITLYLARLHHLGGDVLYVLTGKRYALVRYMDIHGSHPRRLEWTAEGFREDTL